MYDLVNFRMLMKLGKFHDVPRIAGSLRTLTLPFHWGVGGGAITKDK